MMKTPLNIVLASDGSVGAIAAAQWINQHFDPKTTKVTVVNVTQVVTPLFIDATMTETYSVIMQEARDNAVKSAKSAIARTVGPLSEFPIDEVILNGPPVESLLEFLEARRPDLVVMGRRGHSLLQSMVLGSVSFGLLQRASVPILVIEPPDRHEHKKAAQ